MGKAIVIGIVSLGVLFLVGIFPLAAVVLTALAMAFLFLVFGGK